jgi:hypothetical protein
VCSSCEFILQGTLSEDEKGEGEVRTNQAQKVNAEKVRVMKYGGGNQSKAVSRLLHAAVMEVRSMNLDRPHLWAQYIHLGP